MRPVAGALTCMVAAAFPPEEGADRIAYRLVEAPLSQVLPALRRTLPAREGWKEVQGPASLMSAETSPWAAYLLAVRPELRERLAEAAWGAPLAEGLRARWTTEAEVLWLKAGAAKALQEVPQGAEDVMAMPAWGAWKKIKGGPKGTRREAHVVLHDLSGLMGRPLTAVTLWVDVWETKVLKRDRPTTWNFFAYTPAKERVTFLNREVPSDLAMEVSLALIKSSSRPVRQGSDPLTFLPPPLPTPPKAEVPPPGDLPAGLPRLPTAWVFALRNESGPGPKSGFDSLAQVLPMGDGSLILVGQRRYSGGWDLARFRPEHPEAGLTWLWNGPERPRLLGEPGGAAAWWAIPGGDQGLGMGETTLFRLGSEGKITQRRLEGLPPDRDTVFLLGPGPALMTLDGGDVVRQALLPRAGTDLQPLRMEALGSVQGRRALLKHGRSPKAVAAHPQGGLWLRDASLLHLSPGGTLRPALPLPGEEFTLARPNQGETFMHSRVAAGADWLALTSRPSATEDVAHLHWFDRRNGRHLRTVATGPVDTLAASPDGVHLLLAVRREPVVLWDPVTGRPRLLLDTPPPAPERPHREEGRDAAFGPDGRTAWLLTDSRLFGWRLPASAASLKGTP